MDRTIQEYLATLGDTIDDHVRKLITRVGIELPEKFKLSELDTALQQLNESGYKLYMTNTSPGSPTTAQRIELHDDGGLVMGYQLTLTREVRNGEYIVGTKICQLGGES